MNNKKEQTLKNVDLIYIKDLKELLCLEILVDVADKEGVIRRKISELAFEFAKRRIFRGRQSKIFVFRILKKLEEKQIIIRKQRCKADAEMQVCGKHFYYQINFEKNKENLIHVLDQMPELPNIKALQAKVLEFSAHREELE